MLPLASLELREPGTTWPGYEHVEPDINLAVRSNHRSERTAAGAAGYSIPQRKDPAGSHRRGQHSDGRLQLSGGSRPKP